VSGQSFQVDSVIASAGNSGVNNLIINSLPGDTGAVILNGANTFGGTTVISNGTLQVMNASALQNSTLNYDTGVLLFDGSLTSATFGGLAGSTASQNIVLTNLSGAAVTLAVGRNNATTVFGGNVSDIGALTKAGTGTLTLSNANYIGNTTVSLGTLSILGGTNGSSASTFAVQGNSGTAATASATVSGGTLLASQVNIGTAGNQFGAALTISGTANATFSTGVNIGAAGNTGGNLTINTASNVVLGVAVAARDNGGGLIISNGTVTATSLDVVGAGTASVGNANVTVAGGSLTIGNAGSSGAFKVGDATGGTGHGGTLNVSGGALTYLGTDGLLAGNNAGTTPHGNVNLTGGTTTLTGVTLNAGNIAGVTSTLTVGGVNVPVLYLGAVGLVLNPSTGGTVSVTLSNAVVGAVADWSSSAPMTLNGIATLKCADVSSVAHNITLSGVLSGAGGVTKIGGGTLTLSALNTYTSNTVVSAGTLELAQASLFTNSTVSVSNGATLKLDFTTTNVVAGLILNGVSKPAGVYKNSTDPSFISGTGSIMVVPSINPNPPVMGISVSGNIMTLSWPTNAGWILQSNSVELASSSAWFNYPANGAVDVTTINVTINPAKTNVFFRMLKP
jgi:autotransporter-associated beta strand protein